MEYIIAAYWVYYQNGPTAVGYSVRNCTPESCSRTHIRPWQSRMLQKGRDLLGSIVSHHPEYNHILSVT